MDVGPVMGGVVGASGGGSAVDVHTLVEELFNPDSREAALTVLSSKREAIPDLANCLWQTPGTNK